MTEKLNLSPMIYHCHSCGLNLVFHTEEEKWSHIHFCNLRISFELRAERLTTTDYKRIMIARKMSRQV